MKTRAFISSLVLAGIIQFPATAYAANDPISSASASGANGIAPSCELHIFPTKEIFDDSYDKSNGIYAGGGLLDSVIGSVVLSAIISARNAHLAKDKSRATALAQLPIYLSPDEQVKALEKANMLATLKLPADTRVIQEGVLPAPFGSTPTDPDQAKLYKQYWSAMHKGTPIANVPPAVTSGCYRELVVSSITIKKSGNSFKFLSAFVYRTFDKNLSESGIYDGENSLPKPAAFPAQTNEKIEEASMGIQTAFSDNFSAWAARRVKLK